MPLSPKRWVKFSAVAGAFQLKAKIKHPRGKISTCIEDPQAVEINLEHSFTIVHCGVALMRLNHQNLILVVRSVVKLNEGIRSILSYSAARYC